MKLACIVCDQSYECGSVRYVCDCGEPLEVIHDLNSLDGKKLQEKFDSRLSLSPFRSGVWRYKELILPSAREEDVVTRNEGNTRLYSSSLLDEFVGVSGIMLKHEGENPTGSFKDRGMTAAITMAKMLKQNGVVCASTGNTSASMASYASTCGMDAVVLIPDGQIAYGKLSQALAYGAKTFQVEGDFDDAMNLVQIASEKLNLYLLNSANPFRLEGQKAICFELLQQLKWNSPDWIVLPGGNLGNNTALTKALRELYDLSIIDKIPRVAVIQAEGANPLYQMWNFGKGWKSEEEYQAVSGADTVATAIKIGNPVNWKKSIAGLKWCNGVVEQVSDDEILLAKAHVDRAGIGAEPASCATVAGIKKLVSSGVITPGEKVVGILTGHILKDPDVVVNYHTGDHVLSNSPQNIPCLLDALEAGL